MAVTLIAKTVAKNTGDIRAAFDLFKTSLIELLDKLLVLINEHPDEEIPEDKVKINIVHTSKVIQAKYENKLIKMLEDFPFPQKVVLEVLLHPYYLLALEVPAGLLHLYRL